MCTFLSFPGDSHSNCDSLGVKPEALGQGGMDGKLLVKFKWTAPSGGQGSLLAAAEEARTNPLPVFQNGLLFLTL